MNSISAKIVADSQNEKGSRITTFLLTYPRCIHSELMTHRVFSRNSASSRAIPFEKMLEMVEEDPFIPIAWQKDHKGMQGNEYLTDENEILTAKYIWKTSLGVTVEAAKQLHTRVTKQLCNRLLEPYAWHTVLVTATDFDNFFELRCPKYRLSGLDTKYAHSKKEWLERMKYSSYKVNIPTSTIEWLSIDDSQAEIHIQALAEEMYDAFIESTPKTLNIGEWHIPFGDKIQIDEVVEQLKNDNVPEPYCRPWYSAKITDSKPIFDLFKVKIATARCARLSYLTFDGAIDFGKDLTLYETLRKNKHFSPFEHCARLADEDNQPKTLDANDVLIGGITGITTDGKYISGNFRGPWIQYRQMMD